MNDWKLAKLSAAPMCVVLAASPAAADLVLDWNALACDVLVADTELQNPGMASRNLAMLNLALHDGLALTTPSFGSSFYGYGSTASALGQTADRNVAMAAAAHTVMAGSYVGHTSMMSPLLDQTLAATPDGLGKTDGLALGQLIGNSILANRANDGWDTSVQYTHTNEPGHWQPDPVNPGQEAWGPAWGSVATFALSSPSSFAPPAMPDLTSQEYADAFNEVKSLGSVDSTTRTDEQTEIGLFWAYDREGMGTPMRLYNRALSTIAIQEGNTLEENAELFAKAAVATADAGVVAWQSKFEHDFWRPVTGIREADTDGNPLTIADPDWTPLGAPDDDGGVGFTPPFPTYLSGHATFGGAIFGALQEFYGTDDISFLLASEELGGLERS
ncbi:MAG: chloroperoxidase, partial [Planctomycetota bacterium]